MSRRLLGSLLCSAAFALPVHAVHAQPADLPDVDTPEESADEPTAAASLPWDLRIDLPDGVKKPTRRDASLAAGVGISRGLAWRVRAGVDWRVSRDHAVGVKDWLERHVLGLYLRFDLD